MYLAIVDGTGDFWEDEYKKTMEHSFCRQMFIKSQGVCSYQRGPSLDGLRVLDKAKKVVEFLKRAKQTNQSAQLFVAGYSRGGSAVIMASERLARENIVIDAMFLFDPVARHVFPGGEIIPANVSKVFVAQRSLKPSLVAKYEPIDLPGIRMFTQNPMRPSFGVTGERYSGLSTNYVKKVFVGSHGALGGVGWKNVVEDLGCQQNVAHWMSLNFHSVGLNLQLASHRPSN